MLYIPLNIIKSNKKMVSFLEIKLQNSSYYVKD